MPVKEKANVSSPETRVLLRVKLKAVEVWRSSAAIQTPIWVKCCAHMGA
jgi:hypothetical protein